MEMYYLPFLISFIMLIWFKSDALIIWGGLIGLSKFLCIEEYSDKSFELTIKGCSYSYPQFLKDKWNYNFFSKLLGCPLCLSVWLSILCCVILSILILNFLFLVMIPAVCIGSLLLYGSVVKLLNLS